jgi:tetratricopeptide (TPR) repeat protein
MQIAIQSRASKLVFLGVTVAAMLVFAGTAVRPWAATVIASSGSLRGLERAVAIEPGDANFQYMLGRYFLYAEQDTDRALTHYRRALQLNPNSSRYLLDLASLYEFSGEKDKQRAVLKQAVAADPYDPEVRWNAGVFSLLEGETDEALQHFRIVMTSSDYAKAGEAMALAWRATHDTGQMLERMVPQEASSYALFTDFLLRNNEVDAAEQVWSRWSALPGEFTPQLAFPLIDFFIARQRPESAIAVWRRVARDIPELQRQAQTDNLVTNGGFENEALNGGMDWRYGSNELATVELDTSQFHGANRSLKIEFTGEQGSEIGVSQYVPVEPNTTYTFRGYMKADDIYSAHGPQFGIFELNSAMPLLLTKQIEGTMAWTAREGTFRTGPNTKLVQLKVVRGAGDDVTHDATHIKGTAWIDDVAIVPGPEQNPEPARISR